MQLVLYAIPIEWLRLKINFLTFNLNHLIKNYKKIQKVKSEKVLKMWEKKRNCTHAILFEYCMGSQSGFSEGQGLSTVGIDLFSLHRLWMLWTKWMHFNLFCCFNKIQFDLSWKSCQDGFIFQTLYFTWTNIFSWVFFFFFSYNCRCCHAGDNLVTRILRVFFFKSDYNL